MGATTTWGKGGPGYRSSHAARFAWRSVALPRSDPRSYRSPRRHRYSSGPPISNTPSSNLSSNSRSEPSSSGILRIVEAAVIGASRKRKSSLATWSCMLSWPVFSLLTSTLSRSSSSSALNTGSLIDHPLRAVFYNEQWGGRCRGQTTTRRIRVEPRRLVDHDVEHVSRRRQRRQSSRHRQANPSGSLPPGGMAREHPEHDSKPYAGEGYREQQFEDVEDVFAEAVPALSGNQSSMEAPYAEESAASPLPVVSMRPCTKQTLSH